MTFLTRLLFEWTLALSAVLATIVFVLLVLWRRNGNPWPLLIGLVASIGLLIAQGMVETRHELADRLLSSVEQEAVRGQDQSLRALLAPEFRAGSMSRDAFLAWVGPRLNDRPISSLRRLDMRLINSTNDRFRVANRYELQAVVGSFGAQSGYATVEFEFKRVADDWQLVDMPPPSRAGYPMPEWNSGLP